MSNFNINWQNFKAIDVASSSSNLAIIAYDCINEILAVSFQKNSSQAYLYHDFAFADIEMFVNEATNNTSWGAAYSQYIKGKYSDKNAVGGKVPTYLMELSVMQFNALFAQDRNLVAWFNTPPIISGYTMDDKFQALSAVPIEQYSF